MYLQLVSVVVDADAENRREMAEFLEDHSVRVEAQLATPAELEPVLRRPEPPHMAVITLDPAPQETLRAITPLVRRFPNVHFFALSAVVDPNLLMDTMQAGVRQFVPLPIQEDRFIAGLERVAELLGMGRKARIIQVLPSVGGCGATTIACNIATALAGNGKCLIIDLDLVGGAVANAFDIRPRYTIADLMESGAKLDRQLLDSALPVHESSGVCILARPELPEQASRIDPQSFSRLLGILSRVFDYIVIDSRMEVDELHSAVSRAADFNLIVAQLNVPSARNANRYLGALRSLGVEPERMRIVINRFTRRGSELEPEQVERTLGLKISWLVPNDYRNAMAAINYGQPVLLRVPKSEVSVSLAGLAHSLNGVAG